MIGLHLLALAAVAAVGAAFAGRWRACAGEVRP